MTYALELFGQLLHLAVEELDDTVRVWQVQVDSMCMPSSTTGGRWSTASAFLLEQTELGHGR